MLIFEWLWYYKSKLWKTNFVYNYVDVCFSKGGCLGKVCRFANKNANTDYFFEKKCMKSWCGMRFAALISFALSLSIAISACATIVTAQENGDETITSAVEFYREYNGDNFLYEMRPPSGTEIPYGVSKYPNIKCYYPLGKRAKLKDRKYIRGIPQQWKWREILLSFHRQKALCL